MKGNKLVFLYFKYLCIKCTYYIQAEIWKENINSYLFQITLYNSELIKLN